MFSTDFFNLLSICFPFFTLEKFFLLLVSSLLHNTCFSNTHVPYVLNDNCHWHLNVLQDMLLVLHLELGSFCISINSTHTQHPSYNVQWAFLLIFFLFLLPFLHFGILIPTVLEINGRHQTFPDQTSEMSSRVLQISVTKCLCTNVAKILSTRPWYPVTCTKNAFKIRSQTVLPLFCHKMPPWLQLHVSWFKNCHTVLPHNTYLQKLFHFHFTVTFIRKQVTKLKTTATIVAATDFSTHQHCNGCGEEWSFYM